MEQAEYAKEKLEWTPIQYNDNSAILHMISKKPIGVFHLLDDESNFPKASDVSFLGKCQIPILGSNCLTKFDLSLTSF